MFALKADIDTVALESEIVWRVCEANEFSAPNIAAFRAV